MKTPAEKNGLSTETGTDTQREAETKDHRAPEIKTKAWNFQNPKRFMLASCTWVATDCLEYSQFPFT